MSVRGITIKKKGFIEDLDSELPKKGHLLLQSKKKVLIIYDIWLLGLAVVQIYDDMLG